VEIPLKKGDAPKTGCLIT